MGLASLIFLANTLLTVGIFQLWITLRNLSLQVNLNLNLQFTYSRCIYIFCHFQNQTIQTLGFAISIFSPTPLTYKYYISIEIQQQGTIGIVNRFISTENYLVTSSCTNLGYRFIRIINYWLRPQAISPYRTESSPAPHLTRSLCSRLSLVSCLQIARK